jgi:hypothetical protein
VSPGAMVGALHVGRFCWRSSARRCRRRPRFGDRRGSYPGSNSDPQEGSEHHPLCRTGARLICREAYDVTGKAARGHSASALCNAARAILLTNEPMAVVAFSGSPFSGQSGTRYSLTVVPTVRLHAKSPPSRQRLLRYRADRCPRSRCRSLPHEHRLALQTSPSHAPSSAEPPSTHRSSGASAIAAPSERWRSSSCTVLSTATGACPNVRTMRSWLHHLRAGSSIPRSGGNRTGTPE